jgi:phi13 family phage major tail protein
MNDNEYKSVVGADQIYVAEVLEDSASAYTTDTPEYLAPAIEISVKPKTSQDTQYADNRAFDIAVSEAETDMDISVTGLPAAMYAKLMGKQFVSATGRVVDMPGVPPYFALGFRSEKMNGSNRYYWFQKVMFSAPEEGAKTITDKKDPQTLKLTCKAVKTTYKYTVNGVTDGIKRIFGDEDTDSFDETNWFVQVQTPTSGSISAVSLSSSVPAAGASGISKTAAFTLTFNNAMQADVINHITLLDATPAIVADTAVLDTTKKIVTVSHTALAGATAHTIVISGATDIYGQVLADTIVKFTTTP